MLELKYADAAQFYITTTNGAKYYQLKRAAEGIGVNHPAIVQEIPHFDVFPAFLLERPAFLAEFREEKII